MESDTPLQEPNPEAQAPPRRPSVYSTTHTTLERPHLPARDRGFPVQPSPDEQFAELSAHLKVLFSLLRRKLARAPALHHHSAINDRLLHYNIRSEMRCIVRHPYFPDLEVGKNFYVGWGMLEAESVRWEEGARNMKQYRGRVMREQKAIEEVLRYWGRPVEKSLPARAREEEKEKEEGTGFGLLEFLRKKLGYKSR